MKNPKEAEAPDIKKKGAQFTEEDEEDVAPKHKANKVEKAVVEEEEAEAPETKAKKAAKTPERPLIIMHSRRAPLGGGRRMQYRGR